MFSLAQANPGELVEVPNLSLVPRLGRIAQLVEQLTLNQRVQGSSPCAPTNKIKYLLAFWRRIASQETTLDNTWATPLLIHRFL
jgi:hypothetical protein